MFVLMCIEIYWGVHLNLALVITHLSCLTYSWRWGHILVTLIIGWLASGSVFLSHLRDRGFLKFVPLDEVTLLMNKSKYYNDRHSECFFVKLTGATMNRLMRLASHNNRYAYTFNTSQKCNYNCLLFNFIYGFVIINLHYFCYCYCPFYVHLLITFGIVLIIIQLIKFVVYLYMSYMLKCMYNNQTIRFNHIWILLKIIFKLVQW